jgi:Flp pilus assembly protein TadD
MRAPARRDALVALVALVAPALAALAISGCAHFVLLHDPLSAPEHNDLGVAYEARGDRDLARSEYRAALRLDPHLERARVNLGNVEAARGRWASAERCFRRALADSAEDADALNNLAVSLLRQSKRTGEALDLARRAVARGGARDSIYRATLEEATAASR